MSAGYLTPFLTYLPGDATDLEIQQLVERHRLIDSFLEGMESAETVLDCIAEHGGDPVQYLDEVEQSIAFIQDQNLYPENAQILLRQWGGKV